MRFRPGYPDALLRCLSDEFGLAPRHVVADVGAGTGIFSALLLRHGCRVFAVEPNVSMRRAAEDALGGRPGFVGVDGTAEATTLRDASVDWIVAAQAFHWFDVDRARTECRRILRPGGRIAVIFNVRREDTPFLRDYERFVHAHAVDYADVKEQRVEADGRLERFFGPGGFATRTFDNAQRFDFDGLAGRTRSASYMPGPEHPRHAAMIEALRRLFDAHAVDGAVEFLYHTRLFVGVLPAGL